VDKRKGNKEAAGRTSVEGLEVEDVTSTVNFELKEH